MADYTQFNLRGDTKSNWLNANPVLSDREIALETDTQRFKIGNGTSYYNQLPYGRNTGEYLNFYNVTALAPLTAGNYYTHETAILAVPSSERAKGTIVSYETASGVWYTERFVGSDVANWSVLSNWEQMPDSSDLTALHDVITAYNNHAANTSNPHSVTKEQIGLLNVDNTSDLNKPISTATQNALDNKVNVSGDQTIYGVKSFDTSPTVPNPTENNDAVNKATLDLHKNDSTNPHQVTKAQVGLGNADNTSDADKPVSTAQQTALNLKADKTKQVIAGSGLTGGGDLSTDRTINVVATDDSIVVAADGIKVDTQNLLTSTSATKPLAANQGTILDGKITQLRSDLTGLQTDVSGLDAEVNSYRQAVVTMQINENHELVVSQPDTLTDEYLINSDGNLVLIY